MTSRIPASRAAWIAKCGAFSGTIRPDQVSTSPPGPAAHVETSTPFATTDAAE